VQDADVRGRFHVTAAWVRRISLLAVLLGATSATAFGEEQPGVVYPNGVVTPRRDLWPDPIDSAAEFDRASRAEILVFAHALADSETFRDDVWKDRLGIDTVDVDSIHHTQHDLWQRVSQNYAIAARGCAADEAFCPATPEANSFRQEAEAFSGDIIQPRYKAWFDDATHFQETYLNDLLRLAALFPRSNNEIEIFNGNEMRGWKLQDRHFLLSFDDGPTPGLEREGPSEDSKAVNTDLTLDMLRRNHVNGVFFSLGESFQARLRESSVDAMKTLYSGMCVGSHGWTHKSHARWPQWQDSVASSSKLIHDTLPDSYVPAFRPPYGQRLPDSGPYFQRLGLKVVLWNIDSHDWDDALTPDDVRQRVMSLMLLWRRGIVLFHDFFPRARAVVPRLISWLGHDDVTWVNCHDVDWSGGNRSAPRSPARD
jgi:peptidoglycan-N-acetylglucosamine deacetylase